MSAYTAVHYLFQLISNKSRVRRRFPSWDVNFLRFEGTSPHTQALATKIHGRNGFSSCSPDRGSHLLALQNMCSILSFSPLRQRKTSCFSFSWGYPQDSLLASWETLSLCFLDWSWPSSLCIFGHELSSRLDGGWLLQRPSLKLVDSKLIGSELSECCLHLLLREALGQGLVIVDEIEIRFVSLIAKGSYRRMLEFFVEICSSITDCCSPFFLYSGGGECFSGLDQRQHHSALESSDSN